MASNQRQSGRFSMETDSTIRDIWQYAQAQGEGGGFDPAAMNEAVDYRRQIRKDTRPSDMFALDSSRLLNSATPELRPDNVSRAMRRRSTNVNLQKSIQLLDEAVGTPAPLLRAGKSTPTALGNTGSPKFGVSAMPRLDLSMSLGGATGLSASLGGPPGTPGRSVMATPGSSVPNLGDSVFDGSSFGAPPRMGGISEVGSVMEMDEDITTTNVALLLEEDPVLAASTGLFGEFMDKMAEHSAEHQIFELLQEYEHICGEQVTVLKKLLKRAAPGQVKFAKVNQSLQELEDEKHTWRLINSLYKDRLETELKTTTDEPMMLDMLGKHQSDADIVNQLYEKESSVRQGQLVVDWLEKSAQENLDSYYDRVEFFSDQAGAWENTLHYLRQGKEGIPMGSERPIVSDMDPDAPIRQGRPLADLDQDDEARLLKYLFACVRAGQLEEAQKLCARCGQAWRAATLEGWRLYHDPNFNAQNSSGLLEKVQGNPYRDIWKTVCWKMADDEKFAKHERALYAALSGNLKHLLPACESWADYVWAYLKVMVDTRVEQEIRIYSQADRSMSELPKTYWDKIMSMESVFREVQAAPVDKIRGEAKQRFRIIQKYIILGDVDALIEEMYEWVRDDSFRPQRHLVRFMAHLVLFLRTIPVSTKEELCVAIIEAYVRDLIEDKRVHMVAMFVSKLPQNLQIEWYARFLEGIQETKEREQSLLLAQEVGLDIPSITKLVVENIRNRDKTEFSMDSDVPLDSGITDEDKQKIEAIDWLVFDPSQRAEAMRQANAVMRTFLALRKHAAARAVFKKLPEGSIDVIIRNWQMQTGSTELCAEDDNAIREYLCIKSYLDAQDAFNDWFEHYHNAKPSKPDVPQGANFTEKVAYEHREKQYQADMDRWRHSLMLQTKSVEEKIYNVLLFINGGWMVDQRRDTSTNNGRRHQMLLLRQMCLPSLCFLLHKVLHTTEQYQKCVQLADTIADQTHSLYKVFNKDELQKLLQRLRESSIELLNRNKDPLGYDLS